MLRKYFMFGATIFISCYVISLFECSDAEIAEAAAKKHAKELQAERNRSDAWQKMYFEAIEAVP